MLRLCVAPLSSDSPCPTIRGGTLDLNDMHSRVPDPLALLVKNLDKCIKPDMGHAPKERVRSGPPTGCKAGRGDSKGHTRQEAWVISLWTSSEDGLNAEHVHRFQCYCCRRGGDGGGERRRERDAFASCAECALSAEPVRDCLIIAEVRGQSVCNTVITCRELDHLLKFSNGLFFTRYHLVIQLVCEFDDFFRLLRERLQNCISLWENMLCKELDKVKINFGDLQLSLASPSKR